MTGFDVESTSNDGNSTENHEKWRKIGEEVTKMTMEKFEARKLPATTIEDQIPWIIDNLVENLKKMKKCVPSGVDESILKYSPTSICAKFTGLTESEVKREVKMKKTLEKNENMENVLLDKIQSINSQMTKLTETLESCDDMEYVKHVYYKMVQQNLKDMPKPVNLGGRPRKPAHLKPAKKPAFLVPEPKTEISPIPLTTVSQNICSNILGYPDAIFKVSSFLNEFEEEMSDYLPNEISREFDRLEKLGLIHIVYSMPSNFHENIIMKETNLEFLDNLEMFKISKSQWIENLMLNGSKSLIQQIKENYEVGKLSQERLSIKNLYELSIIQLNKLNFVDNDTFFENLDIHMLCIKTLIYYGFIRRLKEKNKQFYCKLNKINIDAIKKYGISLKLYEKLFSNCKKSDAVGMSNFMVDKEEEEMEFVEIMNSMKKKDPICKKPIPITGESTSKQMIEVVREPIPILPARPTVREPLDIVTLQRKILNELPIIFDYDEFKISFDEKDNNTKFIALKQLEDIGLIYRSFGNPRHPMCATLCFAREVRTNRLKVINEKHPHLAANTHPRMDIPFKIDTKEKYEQLMTSGSTLNDNYKDILRHILPFIKWMKKSGHTSLKEMEERNRMKPSFMESRAIIKNIQLNVIQNFEVLFQFQELLDEYPNVPISLLEEAMNELETLNVIIGEKNFVDGVIGKVYVKECRFKVLRHIQAGSHLAPSICQRIKDPFTVRTFMKKYVDKYHALNKLDISKEFKEMITFLMFYSVQVEKQKQIPSTSTPPVWTGSKLFDYNPPLATDKEVKEEGFDLPIDTLMEPPPSKKMKQIDEQEVKKEIKEEEIDQDDQFLAICSSFIR